MPGPTCFLIYINLTEVYPEVSLGLSVEKTNIAIIIATFSFTMLGFLAAVITILFSFSRSTAFRKYSNKGHLEVFFFIYYLAIFCLIITFGLSIISLSSSNGVWPMRLSLISTVNNLIQICLLTVIIVNMAKKSSSSS